MNFKTLTLASVLLLAGTIAVAQDWVDEEEMMAPSPRAAVSVSTGRDEKKMDIGEYWDSRGFGHYYASWNDGWYYRYANPNLPGKFFASQWWLKEERGGRNCNRCSLCPSC
jgi:hypothetical protein